MNDKGEIKWKKYLLLGQAYAMDNVLRWAEAGDTAVKRQTTTLPLATEHDTAFPQATK